MIGVFDSGIGGLTVVRALLDQIPGYDIVYFGDTARTPYGSKSPDTVIGYALENTEFLLDKGAQIIVVACNTASSVAFENITAKYDVPVFEVITPAVELSIKNSRSHRIGIIGTRATVSSGAYERKIREIKPAAKIYSKACPLLVPLVEEGWFKRPETVMIVKKYLHPLKVRQIDTLVLGCTHYPLLKNTIQRKIGKRVFIADSSLAVASEIKNFLSGHAEVEQKISKKGVINFFVSDITPQFEKTARMILKKDIQLVHVNP
ncbi:MAG: glutamate racemase [Deltaproteobacteria bacterium]|nr:glutamate racemase [Deltaproteobacteria bacterium]